MSLFNKKTIRKNSARVEFEMGEIVYFVFRENGKTTIQTGKIVKIDAHLKTNEDGIVCNSSTYGVRITYPNGIQYDVDLPQWELYKSIEACFDCEHISRFDCEILFSQKEGIYRIVLAKTLEEAISQLQTEYPDAYSINELKCWQ